MIKKLRRKFILVAMVSVSCVLLVMMAAINIWNYCKINTYADGVLDLLYANGGRFSLPEGDTLPSDTPPTESGKNTLTRPVPPRKDMNAETPYETRYFTVRYENGEAQVDVRNIAAVSSEEAVTLASEAAAGKKTRGYAGIYRFLVADDGAFILFVDCARQMQTAKNFLESSLLFSGAGLAAVLILVLILSKYAVRPI
ncbi:MAG: two-component sensor histidine kinase, partial [Eubacteriales bacterium]